MSPGEFKNGEKKWVSKAIMILKRKRIFKISLLVSKAYSVNGID